MLPSMIRGSVMGAEYAPGKQHKARAHLASRGSEEFQKTPLPARRLLAGEVGWRICASRPLVPFAARPPAGAFAPFGALASRPPLRPFELGAPFGAVSRSPRRKGQVRHVPHLRQCPHWFCSSFSRRLRHVPQHQASRSRCRAMSHALASRLVGNRAVSVPSAGRAIHRVRRGLRGSNSTKPTRTPS